MGRVVSVSVLRRRWLCELGHRTDPDKSELEMGVDAVCSVAERSQCLKTIIVPNSNSCRNEFTSLHCNDSLQPPEERQPISEEPFPPLFVIHQFRWHGS
jgi:hypothetical protein